MLPLLLMIIGFVIGAAIIVWLVTAIAERLTGRLVNEYFHAAEFILEYHRPPQDWMSLASKQKLLDRLDALISFFETCPFFENEDARITLLTQLRTERDRWVSKSYEELITRLRQNSLLP